MNRLSKNYQDFVYLISCGLNSQKVSANRARQMDFKALLKIARHQNLVNVAYESIKGICKDPEWIQAYEQGIRRSMLFDEERKHIFDFMDAQKIWHAPLKGVVLQDMYPVFGMRQMADNDILFDKNFANEVEAFMTKRGYKMHRSDMHDAYTKAPFYCFEMHNKISIGKTENAFNDYFRDIESRLISQNKTHQRSLSAQDLYLHVVMHLVNHLKKSYGGIKFLCDIYILNNFIIDDETSQIIQNLCQQLHIQNDEATLRCLANKIFAKNFKLTKLSEDEHKIINACFENGDQGNFQNYIRSKIKQNIFHPIKMAKLIKPGLKTWGIKNIIKGVRK